MKRLIFLLLALLVAGSASAATKVQVMTDGVIDVDRLPTISFFQETDPANATDGQLWYNNATNQIKVRDGGMVYHWNATGSAEYDDGSVAPVTYLIDEDFEGTGTPSGWTLTTANVNPDYTTTPISGDESLYAEEGSSDSGGRGIYTFDDASEVWVSFAFNATNVPAEGNQILYLRNEHVNALSFFIRPTIIRLHSSDFYDQEYVGITANTIYYAWVHLNASEKSAELYLSTNNTRPGSPTLSFIDGDSAATVVNNFMIGTQAYVTSPIIIDDVKLSTVGF